MPGHMLGVQLPRTGRDAPAVLPELTLPAHALLTGPARPPSMRAYVASLVASSSRPAAAQASSSVSRTMRWSRSPTRRVAAGPAALPPLRAFTDRTIVEPEAREAELARVRSAAYALNDGESAPGVRTLAVPVLDGAGHARFALAVRATPAVITDERTDWFLEEARSCARALGVLLLTPAERRAPAR
ncbi:putative HTH-type transcriptional regulator RhmR [Streptomyces sp. ADI93-02]|nr:putative HTH-type transcriptional regulator RhmR [Streptomyces sp. ADI93-02]